MPKRCSQRGNWSEASSEQFVKKILPHSEELNDVSNEEIDRRASQPGLRLEPSSWHLLVRTLLILCLVHRFGDFARCA